jgi:hypothetical protein
MGWLTGRDTGTKARADGDRRRVRKCTRHGNAEPCFKCRAVAEQASSRGTGPRSCPKCGKTMRGGVCPGMWC